MLVALQEFNIDTERLPLGTLSKDQVQRGYAVLERLRTALNGGQESLERLSSEFYQVALPVTHCCRQPGLPLSHTCVLCAVNILYSYRHVLQFIQSAL